MHKYAATSLKSSYEALESIVLAMSDQLISGSILQSLGGGTCNTSSFLIISGVLGAHAKKNVEKKMNCKNLIFCKWNIFLQLCMIIPVLFINCTFVCFYS